MNGHDAARAALQPSSELLDRCRRGDRNAVGEIFEQFSDYVYSVALGLTRNENVASDITQDVFVKLLGCFGQFRGDASFKTWLYRIVINTTRDRQRRRRWVSLDDPGVAASLPAEEGQARVATRARAAEVRAAVNRLGYRLRGPVVLRYVAGLSYDEIAAVLGVSPGTVASRLSRAHRRLAPMLADETVSKPGRRGP